MLQQTQVETATPYFRRFMRRFPSVRALARADLQAVLKAWEGLGYYARARHLHRAAREVAGARHGRLPRSAAELRTLPGIGDYTSAAIASISFGEAVPAVDGNVLRVFARFLGIADDISRPPARRKIGEHLTVNIPADVPGDFNQAAMELGALVCRPAGPRCTACPLRRWCVARRDARTADLPVRSRRGAGPHYDIAAAVIRRGNKVLIARRRQDRMLGGLWEFPGGKRHPGETLAETARRELIEETGLEISVGALLCETRHAYTHFSITLYAFDCRPIRGRARPLDADELRWVPVERLRDYPFPAADREIIDLLTAGG
jgi:A/G-specific adenine glycosylase